MRRRLRALIICTDVTLFKGGKFGKLFQKLGVEALGFLRKNSTTSLRDLLKSSLLGMLIDGEKLAELMIDFGVGVTTEASYEIKRIDACKKK